MGPPNARRVAGGGGFEPPLPGPEPGVLPLDDPPPKPTRHQRYHSEPAALTNGGLQRAARLEARHLRGGDRDLLARAWVASVARGALVHAERAEAADRDATALPER